MDTTGGGEQDPGHRGVGGRASGPTPRFDPETQSAADPDAQRPAPECERFPHRLTGTANVAGGLHDRAALCSSADGQLTLVLGIDDVPVEVTVTPDNPIELFDYRSPARFVPIAGVGLEAHIAKGQWLLLRSADGLSFRPDDFEQALVQLDEAGIATTTTTRSGWPGERSDESFAVGCFGGLLAFGLVCLGVWLVSLTGLDFRGPWGRPVVLGIYAVVLALLAIALGRPVQRWRRTGIARRLEHDEDSDERP